MTSLAIAESVICIFPSHSLNSIYTKARRFSVRRAGARALIGGGGGGGGIFIYSSYARLISFQINLKTTDFKRNLLGITRRYE